MQKAQSPQRSPPSTPTPGSTQALRRTLTHTGTWEKDSEPPTAPGVLRGVRKAHPHLCAKGNTNHLDNGSHPPPEPRPHAVSQQEVATWVLRGDPTRPRTGAPRQETDIPSASPSLPGVSSSGSQTPGHQRKENYPGRLGRGDAGEGSCHGRSALHQKGLLLRTALPGGAADPPQAAAAPAAPSEGARGAPPGA